MPKLGNGCDDMISCSSGHRHSGTMFVTVDDFADAAPTCTAAEKDSQKKSGDDVTDKFGELVERFHAHLACLCDIVDLTSKFKFNIC